MEKTIEVTFCNSDGKITWVGKYMSTHPFFKDVLSNEDYIKIMKGKIVGNVSTVIGVNVKIKKIAITTREIIYKP